MNCYVCWSDEHDDEPGETPDALHVVEAWSVEDAAETYAEKRYYCGEEHMDEMTIMVREVSGVVHEVTVTVEFEPTFFGCIR